jgi:hypothetical protein
VYGEHDRDDPDPRDALMHDLDLPRGDVGASWSLIATRVYELNGDDIRALAADSTFRIVPEEDLDIDQDTLGHFRDVGSSRVR